MSQLLPGEQVLEATEIRKKAVIKSTRNKHFVVSKKEKPPDRSSKHEWWWWWWRRFIEKTVQTCLPKLCLFLKMSSGNLLITLVMKIDLTTTTLSYKMKRMVALFIYIIFIWIKTFQSWNSVKEKIYTVKCPNSDLRL